MVDALMAALSYADASIARLGLKLFLHGDIPNVL